MEKLSVTESNSRSISRLGLGTVQFGLNYGINNTGGQVPYQEVCRILETAAEEGINFLDTSRNYGTSETVLGKAMKETGTDFRFTVSTKLDLDRNFKELSDKQLSKAAEESLEKSLEALKLEQIPLYLLHSYDYYSYRDNLIWHTAREQQKKGRIGKLGISIGQGPHEALSALGDIEVQALQIPYNLFDQRWRQSGFLAAANKADLILISRSAYLQGLLLMDIEKAVKRVPLSRPYKEILNNLAKKWDLSLAELVFRYVMDTREITTTIVGIDSLQQLKENCRLYKRPALNKARIREIEEHFSEVPVEVVNPSFWTTVFR